MIRVTAIVLACACMAYSEEEQDRSYKTYANPPDSDLWSNLVRESETQLNSGSTPENLEFRPPTQNWANETVSSGNNDNELQKLNQKLQNYADDSEELDVLAPSKYSNILDPKPFGLTSEDREPRYPGYTKYPNHKYPSNPTSQDPDRPDQYTSQYPKYPEIIALPDADPLADVYPSYPSSSYPQNEYAEPPGLWQPPPFYDSLDNVERTAKIILSRLSGSGRGNIDPKRYSIILGVIEGMTRAMIHLPWQHYEQDYNARVPGLIKYTKGASVINIKSQLECRFNSFHQNISKLKKLMKNKAINAICQDSGVNCDSIIFAMVEAGDKELKSAAEQLIAKGKLSKLYLNNYVQTLDREASSNRPSNLYMFLMSAKNYLKPLIKVAAEAHSLLPPSRRCNGQREKSNLS